MPLTSMTGHADLAGSAEGQTWTWEARSVNGRGLDVRLRLPEGFESLDPILRAATAAALARGSVTISLRLGAGAAAGLPRLNRAALEAAVDAVQLAGEIAASRGLDVAPPTATALLGLRGVLENGLSSPAEKPAIMASVRSGIDPLLEALVQARRDEGTALARTLSVQIAQLGELVRSARTAAEARAGRTGELLRGRVAALLSARTPVDEERLAQELALIAVKADVTEELDRLEAHVAAAAMLIDGQGPFGRKFDFLMQEFNREANTLCSKAASAELTAIGLEMKVVIDQMREQVQNVE